MRRLIFVAVLIAASLAFSLAEVPKQISYQGILKDSTGIPVADGVYAIKFRIYNDSLAGNILWETAGFVPVSTSKGLFQHNLGSTNPLPDSLSSLVDLWAGITINLGSELSPRTKLISVPFSLHSQYSDTANVSLDKTIDAGELILGALDTARYSAYSDLLSEGKIGNSQNQVAVGNHTHPEWANPGTILSVEDTTLLSGTVPGGTNMLLKTISIAPGRIGSFFRISFGVYSYQYISFYIMANGMYLISENVSGYRGLQINAEKMADTLWLVYDAVDGTYYTANINPSLGLELQIYISPGVTTDYRLGEVLVEFDSD